MKQNLNPLLVLAAAQGLPDGPNVPEWVHLLPTAKGAILTFDGRGPYTVVNAEAVIANSLRDPRGIPIDENHSTNLAAPEGREAPARGWVAQMEARADGIWGRVDWTEAGRALVGDRAYRGLSPVILLQADAKTVFSITAASLVNKPNLRDLVSLNAETHAMTLMEQILKALGLAAGATDAEIIAACKATKPAADPKPELQSALVEIGVALGIDGTNTAAIVAAVKGKTVESGSLVALQAENTALAGRVATMETASKRAASEAFVDAAIAAKRAGLNATTRETYIALHMEQPAMAETMIKGMPLMGPSGLTAAPPAADGTVTSLNAEQAAVATQLGISKETYLATLQADRANKGV
jgi:phage I-like protein